MTTLLPECVLPGCKNLVELIGHPCPECVTAFGPSLRVGEPMTADEIADRDAAVHAAYAEQQRTLRIADGREPKRNQLCWLCEQRRTCTKQPGGWECEACRGVV